MLTSATPTDATAREIPLLNLTLAEWEAIERLRRALTPAEQRALTHIAIELRRGEQSTFLRVTFEAGWGTDEYDLLPDGTSAHVGFGASAISLAAEQADEDAIAAAPRAGKPR